MSTPTGNGSLIAGLSLTQILERHGTKRLDLFKCDIEGGEREVFRGLTEPWMNRTEMIIIETHGDDAERIVVDASVRNGFSHTRYGWLHIFRKPHSLSGEALS
jgi:hypothetical protein